MGSSASSREESPDCRTEETPSDHRVDRMLSALGDGVCRELLSRLSDGPLTAGELSRACDIPSSTLYRKMDKLVSGGLVAEGVEISTGGRNATLYAKRVDEMSIRIDGSEGITLRTIDAPEGKPRDVKRN